MNEAGSKGRPRPARLVLPREVAPSPWSNGRGRTRVLAAGGRGSGEGFLWRLSLAELDADAGFSALPGIDRVFTLASGGPLALTVDGNEMRVAVGESLGFEGESDVTVAVAGGCRGFALNLMARRGTGTGTVETGEHHGPLRLDPAAGAVAAMLLKGSAADGQGHPLEELSLVVPGDQAATLECDRALIAVVVFHPVRDRPADRCRRFTIPGARPRPALLPAGARRGVCPCALRRA